MSQRIYDIFGGVCLGLLIAMLGVMGIGSLNQQVTKEEALKPWFDIPKKVQDKLIAKHADVTIKGFSGSGCEIKPGYYLTSLHVITNAILDGTVISVNGQKAEVAWKSSTDEDYAVLTTWAEYDKGKPEFTPSDNFGDNTNIILVGNPGDQEKLVQPAKIIRSAVDNDKKTKDYAKIISAQYVDFGLSGGCAYSQDGETLLGVLTNMYQNPGSTVAEITVVGRPTDK